MLLAIRERIMGFLGWVILSLIFVTFAFWGVQSYLSTSTASFAANVNGVELSTGQHERAYQALMERLRDQLGNNFANVDLDEEQLREQALQNLITEEVLLQTAESAGFLASNAMVGAEINAIDIFKQDGQFSKEQYQRVLRYEGLTPAQFEWQLKRRIMANQMRSGIALSAASTDKAFDREFRLLAQQRRFDHLVLPASLVESNVAVTDSDVEEYYAAHNDEFMSDEQVRLQYIELNAAELSLGSEPDEAEIKSAYEDKSEQLVKPEERRARHILIAAPEDDAQATSAAQARVDEVLERLASGEDFTAVAEDMSDDPGSAPSGGDLGFFGTGIMTPRFEDAVFAMQIGERSEPVQTEFGFHIIELLDIRPEERMALADVRDELIRDLQAEERSDIFFEKSEEIANIAFEQADTLEGVAEQLELEILESDWIKNNGGPGIGSIRNVVDAAYSEDVLQGGNNSTVIEIGDDHIIVLRVLDHQEAALKPLEDVRELAYDSVRKQKINNLLEAKATAYLQQLENNTSSLEEIADSLDLAIEKGSLLARNAPAPDRALVQKAFQLAQPAVGKPVYSGMLMAGGGYAILQLQEVEHATSGNITRGQVDQARRGLTRTIGESEMQMVTDMARGRASIQIPGAARQ